MLNGKSKHTENKGNKHETYSPFKMEVQAFSLKCKKIEKKCLHHLKML